PVSARRMRSQRPSGVRPATATPTTGRRRTWRAASFKMVSAPAGKRRSGASAMGQGLPCARTARAMKLVTYARRGAAPIAATANQDRGGIPAGDPVIDLGAGGVLGLVQRGAEGLAAARALLAQHADKKLPASATVPLADVVLRAPIPRPPSMRDGY